MFLARSTTRVPNASTPTEGWAQQLVHRLAMLGWQPPFELERLLFAGRETCQLCHMATRFLPHHIVVKTTAVMSSGGNAPADDTAAASSRQIVNCSCDHVLLL